LSGANVAQVIDQVDAGCKASINGGLIAVFRDMTDFSSAADRFFTGATPVCPRPENQETAVSHWSFACDE
jgi:hypothetical protein